MVKLKNGVIETVPIGEIKLSLCQSLVKHGVGFTSLGSKVENVNIWLRIYDEVFKQKPREEENSEIPCFRKTEVDDRRQYCKILVSLCN